MDLGIVLKGLGAFGSLASMLSLYFNLRAEGREIAADETRIILKAAEDGESEASDEKLSEQLVTIISKSFLDSAIERIERAEDRFGKAIQDRRYTPAQLDQEADIAKIEVCEMLQLIKDHNEGQLPESQNDYLDSMSRQFKCDEKS